MPAAVRRLTPPLTRAGGMLSPPYAFKEASNTEPCGSRAPAPAAYASAAPALAPAAPTSDLAAPTSDLAAPTSDLAAPALAPAPAAPALAPAPAAPAASALTT